jgi:hypothetical protein
LRTSFSRCPSSSRREGAAASSFLSLRTFIVLEANNYSMKLPFVKNSITVLKKQ